MDIPYTSSIYVCIVEFHIHVHYIGACEITGSIPPIVPQTILMDSNRNLLHFSMSLSIVSLMHSGGISIRAMCICSTNLRDCSSVAVQVLVVLAAFAFLMYDDIITSTRNLKNEARRVVLL